MSVSIHIKSYIWYLATAGRGKLWSSIEACIVWGAAQTLAVGDLFPASAPAINYNALREENHNVPAKSRQQSRAPGPDVRRGRTRRQCRPGRRHHQHYYDHDHQPE